MLWSQFSSREITINTLKDKQLNTALISGGLTAVHGGFPVFVDYLRLVGGGAVITEEELKLERHGMKLQPASASLTPNLDEGCLMLGEFDCTEISKLCFCDAVAYLRYIEGGMGSVSSAHHAYHPCCKGSWSSHSD